MSSSLPVVPEIFVRERAMDTGRSDALIEAAYSFFDSMIDWYYRREEVAEELFWSVAVSDLIGQVRNGGGAQYVMNRRWDQERVRAVRAGLQAMSADEHLQWFEWLAAQVSALDAEIPRFLSSPGFGDKDIHDALCHKDREFFALKRTAPIERNHGHWLRSLPIVKPLDDKQFDEKMYELVESTPDYKDRIVADLHRGHSHSQMERLLLWKSGQRLHRHHGPGRADLKNLTEVFTVTLTRGKHEITQYRDRAELRDMKGVLLATAERSETRDRRKHPH
jgi:hypothetical protein